MLINTVRINVLTLEEFLLKFRRINRIYYIYFFV